jgi:hypothetical protein
VEPVKFKLKAPETERLKPKYNKLLSIFAFNVNLRCYDEDENAIFCDGCNAVYHTHCLGRAMQFDPVKPTFKAPGSRRLKPKHG